ncbi:MAG: Mut7-C RNAse domain-containing protein [Vicinamibacterales bacterium]
MDFTRPVTLRFYAELNDFLQPERKQEACRRRVAPRTSVKDLIQSLGVPHTEVDLLLVDGVSASFDRLLEGGERVAVFPRFRRIDVETVSLVRTPAPLGRFVLDVHLGRLATYLRLAGFDSVYRNDASDSDLSTTARQESRILLTRDVGLLQRNEVACGYFVRETAPAAQLAEVIRRFDLADEVRPFTRCLRCNVLVEAASDTSVRERVPPRVRERHVEFSRCPACSRVYWKGTHYEWMVRLLATLTTP